LLLLTARNERAVRFFWTLIGNDLIGVIEHINLIVVEYDLYGGK